MHYSRGQSTAHIQFSHFNSASKFSQQQPPLVFRILPSAHTPQQPPLLGDQPARAARMLAREKSQELPSSLAPQWMLNRGAGAGAAAAGTAAGASGGGGGAGLPDAPGGGAAAASGAGLPAAKQAQSPAAGRDRWGEGAAAKEESKWGPDPFAERRMPWGVGTGEESDRGPPGRAAVPRDAGRWKGAGGEWGSAVQREPVAFAAADRGGERWGDARAELREPREPVPAPARDRAARWRADDKPGDKWTRGGAAAGGEPGTWRAGGAEGRERLGGARMLDDPFGRPERLNSLGRDEQGFGGRALAEERGLLPGKGRGFGAYGRGRALGGPLAPGATLNLGGGFEREWGRDSLDEGRGGAGAGGRPGVGFMERGGGGTGGLADGRTKSRISGHFYTSVHLNDIKKLMTVDLGGREFPLPPGISTDELAEIHKGFKYLDEFSRADTNHAAPPPAAAASAAAGNGMPAAAPVSAAPAPEPAVPPPQQQQPAPAAALDVQLPPGMPAEALGHNQWFYRDPKGLEQGPFVRDDILDWAESGFFDDTLPLRSALPGQEGVWTTLHAMLLVWAQIAKQSGGAAAVAAAAAGKEQQQHAAPGQYPQPGSINPWQQQQQPHPGFGSPHGGPPGPAAGMDSWLRQQAEQHAAAATAAGQHPGAPAGFPYGPGLPHHHPLGGGAAGLDHGAAAAAAAAAAAQAGVSAPFPHMPPSALFGPHAGHFGGPPGGPPPHHQPLSGAHHHPGGPPPPQAQQPPSQQRTLFGTPLEPSPPAAGLQQAPISTGSSTGSRMLDLLYNAGKRTSASGAPQQPQQLQQPQQAAEAAAAGDWEQVPSKASKQQERATHQHQQQQQQLRQQQEAAQQWQQAQAQRQAPPAAADDEDCAGMRVPSGPVEMPLFPQQHKAEQQHKVAPWAAAAAPAAAPRPKSLKEIQEEEQARAAAEEAARAEAAAAAAANQPVAAGPWAAAGAGRPNAAAAGPGGGVPPGWGPPPAAAPAAARQGSGGAAEDTAPLTADDLPAAMKKATLGDVLKARLGGAGGGRKGAEAPTATAAGPWGAAAGGQRPAANLNQIMLQEQTDREESYADLEGGAGAEEGLDELIAALRQRNNAAAAAAAASQQQQQQRRQQPDADDELFWNYGGGAPAAAAAAQPAAQPAPAAAKRQAAAAAAEAASNPWGAPPPSVVPLPRAPAVAPSAAAPPPVAGPWARAAASNAIKAPPPGAYQVPAKPVAARAPAAAAAPAARPAPAARAAATPAAAANGQGSGAAGSSSNAAGGGGSGAAAASPPLFMGGLDISPEFASWCRAQMVMLNGNDDLSAIEFFLSLGSNSEIAESAAAIWAEKPGVSTFVTEFVKRKVAEQNRKPGGGRKKKGKAASSSSSDAAAAAAAAAQQQGSVSAAAVGMINTGGTDAWSRIPKKPGGAAANKKGGKAKGGRVEASLLGFTTKSPLELLAEDD